MNDDFHHSPAPDRGIGVRKVLCEAALVAMVGAAIAFAANAISPRGLALARNYFPGPTQGEVSTPVAPPPSHGGVATQGASPAQLAEAQLKAKGLQWVELKQAIRLFRDPRFPQGGVVFIDARDGEHYREGHVPGAHEFDPYHMEKHFADVLPACQAADEIVVYCHGGDCEDSQFAAAALRDAGIPNQKLFVYIGGMEEWTTNGFPMETGERNSGNLRNADR